MKKKLLERVRKQYDAAATQQLAEFLQQDSDQLQRRVESTVPILIEDFATVAEHQSGRQRLYEAIRYCDEDVVENPVGLFRGREPADVLSEMNNHLAGIVGDSNKEKMIDSLRSRGQMSAADAANMLACVTPGVLAVLKHQISTGQVFDNADGVGQMFLGEGDISKVDTSKKPLSGGTTIAAATTAAENGADMSWLVRYTMPAVLLGGLVLGGVNNCGNRAEQRIVADQRMKLQIELDTVLEQNQEAQGKIFSLQSDYDTARAQSSELASRAELLTSELDLNRQRVSELEAALDSAVSEGDAAKAEVVTLSAQAANLTTEFKNANDRVAELEKALGSAEALGDSARADVKALSSQSAALASALEDAESKVHVLENKLRDSLAAGETAAAEMATKTSELEAANAGLEVSQSELSALKTQAAQLNSKLEQSNASVSELTGELALYRREASTLRGQLMSVTSELNRVKDLPAETTALQGLLAEVVSERDSFLNANVVNKGKLQTAVNERNFARVKLTELESELGKVVGKVADKSQQLQKLGIELEDVTAARDAAVEKSSALNLANVQLRQQVDAGIRQVADLESRLRTATERLLSLDTNFAATSRLLDEEKSARTLDVNRLTAQSSDLQGKLSEMLGLRDDAVSSLAMRDSEIADLDETVNVLRAEVQALTNANAKASDEALVLKQQIEALNAELDSTQSKVDDASTELDEREQLLAAVNADLGRTGEKLAAITSERDQLLSSRDVLASRNSELIAEKDEALAEVAQLTATIESLTGELDTARTDSAESENKISLLNDSMNNLQKELRVITGARSEASAQAKALRAESTDLAQRLAQLQSEFSAEKSAHEREMGSIQAAHNEVMSSMQSETEEKLAQIESLADELEATEAELAQVTNALAALKTEKAAAAAELAAVQQKGIHLQTSLESQTSKSSQLESTVASLESENSVLTEARDLATRQVGELTEELETLTSTLTKERASITQLNEAIGTLETLNSGIAQERDDALGVIKLLEVDLVKSNEQASSLYGQRAQLQQQLDAVAASAQAQIDYTRSVRDDISSKLARAGIDSATVSRIEGDNAVAITLGSSDLYSVGSATLSRSGNELLAGVGQVIADYPDWRVDVEGHTDSQGIGAELRARYPTNWELSTARASAAVRYLAASTGLDAEKMSARGYADTRPIASNETAEGRERNRRVEIVLRN